MGNDLTPLTGMDSAMLVAGDFVFNQGKTAGVCRQMEGHFVTL
jgi:hypothetical protein